MKPVTVPFFISHQGCPHACLFCDQRTISGSAGDLPSSGQIIERVVAWKQTAAGRPLDAAFFGGSFTALPWHAQKRLLAPLQPFLADGTIRSVRISTRPDYVTVDQLVRLKRMGVFTVELGVQSMDDEVLKRSGRGHTADASEKAIRHVKDQELSVVAQLMPGLPGDTPAASRESLMRVIRAGADAVRIYPAVVLAGTGLARLFQEGSYRPLSLGQGIDLCKVLLHQANREQIKVLRIGLQAETGLNHSTVLAGCWHPALGHLVRSALWGDLLDQLTAGVPDGAPLVIRCHPSIRSDVAGHGSGTIKRLRSRLDCRIVPDSALDLQTLALDFMDQRITGNLLTDLNYSLKEV